MNEELNGKEISELKELDEQAEIEAATLEAEPQEIEEPEIIYRFMKPYKFDGETYEEIDLSGITRFNTRDAEYLDRVLKQAGHSPQNKWFDTTYIKMICVRATNKPVAFFNNMHMKDFMEIEARVRKYFLFM